MEKLMVTHRLSLDMSNQAVQATITLAQYDTATHRLIVSLRHGAEVVELPPGSYAVAVQNPDAGVDVLDSVTVYGPDSVYPNCIVYDVSEAVTAIEGMHEAQFLITYMDENDTLRQLSSPRIAFVIKPDIMCASDIKSSSYGAVVQAQAAAETAKDAAETAQAAAETAKGAAETAQKKTEGAQAAAETAKDAAETAQANAEAVGVVSLVTVLEDSRLEFTFEDGRKVVTNKSVRGKTGEKGEPFRISKNYASIEEMEADETDDVLIGQFVAIITDVEDDDNAKVYIKTEDGYQFVVDMSGKQGVPGPKGDPGKDADEASVIAAVTQNLETYIENAFLKGVW